MTSDCPDSVFSVVVVLRNDFHFLCSSGDVVPCQGTYGKRALREPRVTYLKGRHPEGHAKARELSREERKGR